MSARIEHSIPAYVPTPPGRSISHYVEFDYPKTTGCAVVTEAVPCYGEAEAALVARTNKRLGMGNVRTSTAAEYRARQTGGAS